MAVSNLNLLLLLLIIDVLLLDHVVLLLLVSDLLALRALSALLCPVLLAHSEKLLLLHSAYSITSIINIIDVYLPFTLVVQMSITWLSLKFLNNEFFLLSMGIIDLCNLEVFVEVFHSIRIVVRIYKI